MIISRTPAMQSSRNRTLATVSSAIDECRQLHARCLRSSTSCNGEAATWDHLIRSYCNLPSQTKIPVLVYKQMQSKGVQPTQFTLPPLLKFLTASASLCEGSQIHGVASKSSFITNVFVVHSLISLYAKCTMVESCRRLFDEMPVRNSVSWNVMIGSYCQNGFYEEAVALFRRMQELDHGFDKVTLVSVLPACAHLGAVGLGEWIHREGRKGGDICVYLGTALIDMYCKCGFAGRAWAVFEEMRERNIVTWNAMIGGFAMHGYSDRVLDLFEKMRLSPTRPNYVTFICMLCACTHAGLVDRGWQYFTLMKECYSINPTIQHYACMVDLLGRAGHFDQAEELIASMPMPPDGVIWGALLGACRMHNNVVLGEKVMKRLVELEPRNCGNHMILSNIYADAGRWEEAYEATTKMKRQGIQKLPGCSWIEIGSEVHRFYSGDRSHPWAKSIYEKLEQLQQQLKAAGYVPNTRAALRNVEEEDKEDAVKVHSEKLALAFGLLLSPSPDLAAIRVVKNLRVCVDCHTFMKHVSRVVQREIIVRDNSRFHHFRDGSCTCMDYW